MHRAADVDLRFLGWSRAAIGALVLLRTTPLLVPSGIWYLRDTIPLLGWPDGSWNVPGITPGFVQALCVVRTVSAALFMVGVATRPAGIVCGLTGYLVVAQSPFGFFFTIHLLYQAAILLALCDAGSAFALRPVPPRSPDSSYRMMQWWIASIYVWAGLYKLRPD